MTTLARTFRHVDEVQRISCVGKAFFAQHLGESHASLYGCGGNDWDHSHWCLFLCHIVVGLDKNDYTCICRVAELNVFLKLGV